MKQVVAIIFLMSHISACDPDNCCVNDCGDQKPDYCPLEVPDAGYKAPKDAPGPNMAPQEPVIPQDTPDAGVDAGSGSPDDQADEDCRKGGPWKAWKHDCKKTKHKKRKGPAWKKPRCEKIIGPPQMRPPKHRFIIHICPPGPRTNKVRA